MAGNKVFVAVADYSAPIILNWPKILCPFDVIMDGRSISQMLGALSSGIKSNEILDS
jgi:hypothetical protein